MDTSKVIFRVDDAGDAFWQNWCAFIRERNVSFHLGRQDPSYQTSQRSLCLRHYDKPHQSERRAGEDRRH